MQLEFIITDHPIPHFRIPFQLFPKGLQSTLCCCPWTTTGPTGKKKICAIVFIESDEFLNVFIKFRKMSVRTFGHIDSIVSVVVNAVEVLYGNKELMTYSLEHNPESGSIVYRQGLPFKWKSFKEFPGMANNPLIKILTNTCVTILDIQIH